MSLLLHSPYYRAMVDPIAEVGKYLDMEYDDYTRYLEEHFQTWKEYGCTLMCDGWTSNNRRHIINSMAYCVNSTLFIRYVDTSGHQMDAQYLYSLMDETSRHIDGWDEYVVAVVTDNADNFKAVGRILHEKNPHIVWVPFIAHCIDLIMEDIGKVEEIHKTIEEGKTVTGLIYNHQFMID